MGRSEWVHRQGPDDVLAAMKAETVEVDDWHRIPKRSHAVFQHAISGVTVEVDVDASDGTARVVSLKVDAALDDPRGIDRDRLRTVPVGELMRRCVAFGTKVRGSDDRPGWVLSNQTAKAAERWLSPTGRSIEDQVLRETAEFYNNHRGSSPTKAVATRFSLSQSGAAKRVQKARRAGLIPPTRKGRATNRTDEEA